MLLCTPLKKNRIFVTCVVLSDHFITDKRRMYALVEFPEEASFEV